MRTIVNKLAFFIVMALLFTSCSSDNKKGQTSGFLPPVSIQIPDEVKGDPEIVDLIKSSEKSINEFSNNIERLAVDGKDILKKNEEDYSLTDGLKAGKLMLQFVSNSTQMASTMQDFTNYIEKKQEQGLIDDKQLKALEQVGETLEKRIDEINEKYKDYFDKK